MVGQRCLTIRNEFWFKILDFTRKYLWNSYHSLQITLLDLLFTIMWMQEYCCNLIPHLAFNRSSLVLVCCCCVIILLREGIRFFLYWRLPHISHSYCILLYPGCSFSAHAKGWSVFYSVVQTTCRRRFSLARSLSRLRMCTNGNLSGRAGSSCGHYEI